MKQPTWAGGAKMTWADVKRIRARKKFTRDDAGRMAERLHVNKETVWRAYMGWSWVVARFQRLPEEHKKCVVCGGKFPRRFPSGRHRSDTFWAQKETCSRSCFVTNSWRKGHYANR